MFRSLSIQRFRGFRSLKVDGLERFSLFIGKNNVGKTALLESIFLLAGPTNPTLPLRLNSFRGLEEVRVDPEELWGWLFYEKDLKSTIVLEMQEESRKTRRLKIRLGQRKEIRFVDRKDHPSKGKRSDATASTVSPRAELTLEYRSEHGKEFHTKASVTENAIRLERAESVKLPNSVYVSSRGGYSPENPERFSELQEVGRESEVIPALQVLEPRLTKLSVLVSPSGSMIHGDIGIGRMVPVPMMGEGIGRLLTLLLAITTSRGGFVMVDEIDTGFHYSVLSDVWTAIAETARREDVQVFATTHSWECLREAHESFSKSSAYDFHVHRLDRDQESVTSTTYDREMLEVALMSGMELR